MNDGNPSNTVNSMLPEGVCNFTALFSTPTLLHNIDMCDRLG